MLSGRYPGAVRIPFSLSDFQQFLNEGRLRFPQVQCFAGGTVVSPSLYTRSTHSSMSEIIDPVALGEMVEQHRTVRISDVHQLHPPLGDFAAAMSEAFGCSVGINAYYCQGPAGGLAGHYDGHHIFAAQIAGEKRWKLGPVVIDSPDREFRPRPTTPPAVERTVIVKAGCVLYVPPGMWHDVFTDDVSLHLSIGIHPRSWIQCLEKLLEASRQRHPLLRAAVPFSIEDGRCVYRHELRGELQQLLDLIKADVPASVEGYFSKSGAAGSVTLPQPEPSALGGEPVSGAIAELVDALWSRVGNPRSLYIRGSPPRPSGQQEGCWDLDLVLVIEDQGAPSPPDIGELHDELRRRFPELPPIDLFCCTESELATRQSLLPVRLGLMFTGRLVRGEPLRSVRRRPLPDAGLATELAQQMRRWLEIKVTLIRELRESEAEPRLPSFCKSALRVATVLVMREEDRFVRDPVDCYFEIVRRYPHQAAGAELLLDGLFGRKLPPPTLLAAAERLFADVLK